MERVVCTHVVYGVPLQVLTYVHMTCIDALISEVIQWSQDHTIIIRAIYCFLLLLGLKYLHGEILAKRFFFLFCGVLATVTVFLSPSPSAYIHTATKRNGFIYTWYRNWLYLKLSHEKLAVVGLFLLHIAPKQSHWQGYWSCMKLS